MAWPLYFVVVLPTRAYGFPEFGNSIGCYLEAEVETHLGYLKTTMKMDVPHYKTALVVLKELTVFAIVYNLVRLVILHSAQLWES
jgi:hypothetical protein